MMRRWREENFIPQCVTRLVAEKPALLLSEFEKEKLEPFEREACKRSLLAIPPEIENMGPWIGGLAGGPEVPDVVLAGICQAKNTEEKSLWLAYGPSIETVCGLDSAWAIARYYGARFQIWVIDHEYANVSHSAGTDYELDLAVGTMCREFAESRYPNAEVYRTSDDSTRQRIYAIATSLEAGRLFPNGVQRPFAANNPTLWNQIGYLACVGIMASPAIDEHAVWAITDHDQFRSVLDAQVLARVKGCPGVGGLLYWPVPQIQWTPPPLEELQVEEEKARTFMTNVLQDPRRQYRARLVESKIHLCERPEELRKKLRHGQYSPTTVREIIAYLDPDDELPEWRDGEDVARLDSALNSLRNRYPHTSKPE